MAFWTLMQRSIEQRRGVAASLDLRRVKALPRRKLDFSLTPDLTPLFVIEDHGCSGCPICKPPKLLREACDLCALGRLHLHRVQSAMLFEAEAAGGLLGLVGVGEGKELTSLLLAEAMGAKSAVLLTKPRLKDQLLRVDIPRYGKHFRLPLGQITVVSYSELSSAGRVGLLERLEPDVLICNEAHALRALSSMRTKQVKRFLEDRPHVRCAFLSGSMAADSPIDYAHMASWALRSGSPLPTAYRELQDWHLALASGVKDYERRAPGALLGLCGQEALEREPDFMFEDGSGSLSPERATRVARGIYRRRLVETSGVVATAGGEVGCSLQLVARTPVLPEACAVAIQTLRLTWMLDGEEIEDAARMAAIQRQLANGFYYRWKWPSGKPDLEWLDARAAWHRFVRHALQRLRRDPPLLSPLLVWQACAKGELSQVAWARWKAIKDRYRPQPPTETIWLSDFLVRDVLAWCSERTEADRGIVWYRSRALEEAFRAAGLTVYAAGEDTILNAQEPAICASLEYREGLNIQDRYSRALVVEPPANGGAWQQLLGRLHRLGQTAEEVEYQVHQHEVSVRAAFAAALEDAYGLEQREGERQKLVLADKSGFELEG